MAEDVDPRYSVAEFPAAYLGFLFLAVQDWFFHFFGGCLFPSLRTVSGTLWNTSKRSVQLCVVICFVIAMRCSLRADLGQRQSGNSSLFAWGVSRRSATVELAISEILPITSVHAPRYFVGRSSCGAKET